MLASQLLVRLAWINEMELLFVLLLVLTLNHVTFVSAAASPRWLLTE